jgi:2'-hydroxyisoflavone reductase
MVDASARLLAPSVKQYVFISSVSVYTSEALPGNDESGELAVLKDPKTESFGNNYENYGAGKAACEAAAEKAMPGRVANIRPGFIVGPRDTSGRFAYWPIRVEKGGEMAVPGKPTDPIQIIDVRDLAEWIVRLIETNTNGVFNATGPEQPLTMKEMVLGCKAAAKSDTTFTWIDEDFLTSQGLSDADFPPVGSCHRQGGRDSPDQGRQGGGRGAEVPQRRGHGQGDAGVGSQPARGPAEEASEAAGPRA